MSNTYKRAIAVASDLVEGVDLTNAANREYTRGIVEFMADFFPQSASKVARDLGIDPDDIEAAGYDGRGRRQHSRGPRGGVKTCAL